MEEEYESQIKSLLRAYHFGILNEDSQNPNVGMGKTWWSANLEIRNWITLILAELAIERWERNSMGKWIRKEPT